MWDMLWLLVAIPVVVYLLSTLLRGGAEQKDDDETERPPREGRRRSEASATDVDRFLAEVNRRRREAAREEAQAPYPRPQPQSSRPRQRERVERERIPPVIPVARRGEDPQRRTPTVEVRRSMDVVEAVPVLAVEPVFPADAAPAFPTQAALSERARSPVIAMATALLRSPRSVGAALVLQEILGPPRCRRRR